MAKFKVGDKVTDGDAIYLITGVTGLDYIWKCISGTPNPHWLKGGEKEWAEEQVEIANSCVENAEGCVVNSTREIVQKALNRKATNAGAAPTYIGNGVYKVGDIVNYNGSAWEVVSKSQLGIGNGQAKVAYGLKSIKTGVVVKGVPEHNISPKNSLVAKNTQGDALSDAASSMREAIKELNSSTQSLNLYFQYKLSDGASQKDVATDAKLRAEVKKAQSQLSSAINGITALEKTVAKLRDTADASGF